MKPFVAKQWKLFVIGCLFALVVVGIRIAFPWPLKAILHQWVNKSPKNPNPGAWFSNLDPTVVNATAYFLLLVLLGWVDYWERWFFARFAINIAHDLRLKAVDSAVIAQGRDFDGVGTGELVSRLIGDLARFKAGLKGFLVHVATNGAHLIGVIIVLFFISAKVGIVMGVAGVVIFFATLWGASATYNRAKKYRQKEGHLAESIHHATDKTSGSSAFAAGSRESGNHEAALTQIQGRTTWFTHTAFGLAVVTCLILGAADVKSGQLDPGDVVVFILYATMLRAPMIQLSRQGARTGKIMACLVRIHDIIQNCPVDTDNDDPNQPAITLSQSLEARDLVARARGVGRRLIGPVSFNINAGEKVLILGNPGSGKTSLLQAIRGNIPLAEGCIVWDGKDLAGIPRSARSQAVAFLSEKVHWSRQPIGSLVDPDHLHDPDTIFNLIERLGGKKIVRRLKLGPKTKLASNQLSFAERKTLVIARLLLTGPSVLLFDQPHAGLSRKHTRRVLRNILQDPQHRTIIVASSDTRSWRKFDRIIQLRSGRCIFSGTPDQWNSEWSSLSPTRSSDPVES